MGSGAKVGEFPLRRTSILTPELASAQSKNHATARRTGFQQSSDNRPKKPNMPVGQRPPWLSKSPRNLEFVFFDLETTGGNPSNSEVIEIAAIKEHDGKITGRFQTLVNPRRHIPRPVREITGIDQSMVRDAPFIEDVIDELIDFIGDGILVSHGVLNDFSFIAHYARNLRAKEVKNFYVCTHLLVSNFLPNIPVKSLSGIADYFGVAIGNAHRAMADAEMTRSVFWEIQKVFEKNGFKSLEDLLKIQGDNFTLNRLGPGLLSHSVEKAPTTPGLFYLFNSSREVAYMSATTNMRKSLMNLTELSDERDFNRLLVDVTDFRFERTAHFLAALLQEKRELKKLELSVDPRKFERRSDNTVQILLPDDLLAYWQKNPSALPFSIPSKDHRVIQKGLLLNEPPGEAIDSGRMIRSETQPKSASLSDQERNQYAYAHLENLEKDELKVPIRKTRRLVNAIKNPKYQLNRLTKEKRLVVHLGQLVSGTGWFFGPFEQPKLMRKKLDELLTLWPFHDSSLSMEQRAEMATHFIQVLLGNFDAEIQRIAKAKNAVKNIFNPIKRHSLNQTIELIKALQSENYAIPDVSRLKTGIAVLTNTDTKELNVAVVVRGRIRQQLRLPVEDAEKLRSERFFTRLMVPYHSELFRDDDCMEFNEDVCDDLELFAHWISKRRGEGEWVDFATLAPLYNSNASE